MNELEKTVNKENDESNNSNKSPNNTQRKALVKEEIVKFINQHREDDSFFAGKNEMYEHLNRQGVLHGLKRPTFYKYLKEMDCEEIAPGKYDFVTKGKKKLNTLISKDCYNKMVTYKVKEAYYHYVPFMAKILNDYFHSTTYKTYFMALNNVLVCFYYYEKGEENSISKAKIKQCMNDVLSNYSATRHFE